MKPGDQPIRSEGAPIDRLTRIAEAVGDAFRAHPEFREGDRGVVFLNDGDRGGAALFDYEDDSEAVTDVIMHLRAMLRANGMDLVMIDASQLAHDGGTPASPRAVPPSPN